MVKKGQTTTQHPTLFVTQIDVQLPNRVSAPAAARQALGDLESRMPPEVFQDMILLANELVTNSIRHSGIAPEASVGIKVALSGTAVRVEVADEGCGFDAEGKKPHPDQTSGWGLHLIKELADRWGNESGDRCVVWFEINC